MSNLKNIGYTCVAMHPYYDTGWSRNIVYPNMGLDETHFIDDFDQTKILRDYITDQELYEKIVDRYESKKSNEDLFIMSISMQNHGGYTEKYDNFDEKARMLGINYPDVNQYLFRYWQLASGRFAPKKPDSTYLTIGKQSESEVERLLRGGKYRVVCVNDDPMDFDFDTERQQLVDIFQRTFPQTSAFERS